MVDKRIQPFLDDLKEAQEKHGCVAIPDAVAIGMAWDAWARRRTGPELAATLNKLYAMFSRPGEPNCLWAELEEIKERVRLCHSREGNDLTSSLAAMKKG